MTLTKKHWIAIISVAVILLAIWYFFLKKKPVTSTSSSFDPKLMMPGDENMYTVTDKDKKCWTYTKGVNRHLTEIPCPTIVGAKTDSTSSYSSVGEKPVIKATRTNYVYGDFVYDKKKCYPHKSPCRELLGTWED